MQITITDDNGFILAEITVSDSKEKAQSGLCGDELLLSMVERIESNFETSETDIT